MNVLVLNGSIHGAERNCGVVISQLPSLLPEDKFEIVNLYQQLLTLELREKVLKADALLIITGTYWDSWGSPLQKFLEDFSDLEADPLVVGKPVGIIVMHHSVGGKGILSRLQGVLSSIGFLIPPMSGVVLAKYVNGQDADTWTSSDLTTILANLKKAASINIVWDFWKVGGADFDKVWFNIE